MYSQGLTRKGEAGYSWDLPRTKGIEEALVTALIIQGGIPEGNGWVMESQLGDVHLVLIGRLEHNPMVLAEGDHVFRAHSPDFLPRHNQDFVGTLQRAS